MSRYYDNVDTTDLKKYKLRYDIKRIMNKANPTHEDMQELQKKNAELYKHLK